MLGGGAGTYASLGKQGPPVQQGIGRLAAACGKIGREIYTLMKTEFGEVEEPVPPGTVGSSTMQQKRNPKLCQDIIAAAAGGRGLVPLALEAMTTEHEADRTTSLMMDAAESRGLYRNRRHPEPPGGNHPRAARRSQAHAGQPRPRWWAYHGGSGDARPRRRHRPAACA